MALPPILVGDDLLKFRTRHCERFTRQGHCRFADKCQYSHDIEWTRRPLWRYEYSPVLCPAVGCRLEHQKCLAQRQCQFSHTREEQAYHPAVYKKNFCEVFGRGESCPRYYCPFAHGAEELRGPANAAALAVLHATPQEILSPLELYGGADWLGGPEAVTAQISVAESVAGVPGVCRVSDLVPFFSSTASTGCIGSNYSSAVLWSRTSRDNDYDSDGGSGIRAVQNIPATCRGGAALNSGASATRDAARSAAWSVAREAPLIPLSIFTQLLEAAASVTLSGDGEQRPTGIEITLCLELLGHAVGGAGQETGFRLSDFSVAQGTGDRALTVCRQRRAPVAAPGVPAQPSAASEERTPSPSLPAPMFAVSAILPILLRRPELGLAATRPALLPEIERTVRAFLWADVVTHDFAMLLIDSAREGASRGEADGALSPDLMLHPLFWPEEANCFAQFLARTLERVWDLFERAEEQGCARLPADAAFTHALVRAAAAAGAAHVGGDSSGETTANPPSPIIGGGCLATGLRGFEKKSASEDLCARVTALGGKTPAAAAAELHAALLPLSDRAPDKRLRDFADGAAAALAQAASTLALLMYVAACMQTCSQRAAAARVLVAEFPGESVAAYRAVVAHGVTERSVTERTVVSANEPWRAVVSCSEPQAIANTKI